MKKYLNSVEEVVELLKEGQLITSKLTNRVYQMSNGIIYSTYKGNDTTINDSIYFAENVFYTEEPEQLKFEVNRAYKNLNDSKVFLNKFTAQGMQFVGLNGQYTTDVDGFIHNGSGFNIVGYWEEEK